MCSLIRWWLSISLILILVPMDAQSQSISRLSITTPAAPDVSLVPYDANTHSEFALLFEGATGEKVRPFAVVLTNSSQRSIIALTVRWNSKDFTGQLRTHNQMTDGLFLNRSPVVSPNAKLLIAPNLFVPGALLRTGFIGASTTTAERDVDELSRFQSPTVTLDAIVFEDGVVSGPDESETIASLIARKAAVDELIRTVRAAKVEQRDIPTVLAEMAGRRPDNRSDHIRIWTSRLAATAGRSDDLNFFLEQLAQIPAPRFQRVQ